MDAVNWDRVLLLVVAGVGGVWALFSRLAPQIFGGWTASKLDEQEHRQHLEQEQMHYRVLSEGWANEQITIQLQEHSEFARNVIYDQQKQIMSRLDALELLLDQTQRKQAALGDKITLLISTISEMYDYQRKNTKPE